METRPCRRNALGTMASQRHPCRTPAKEGRQRTHSCHAAPTRSSSVCTPAAGSGAAAEEARRCSCIIIITTAGRGDDPSAEHAAASTSAAQSTAARGGPAAGDEAADRRKSSAGAYSTDAGRTGTCSSHSGQIPTRRGWRSIDTVAAGAAPEDREHGDGRGEHLQHLFDSS